MTPLVSACLHDFVTAHISIYISRLHDGLHDFNFVTAGHDAGRGVAALIFVPARTAVHDLFPHRPIHQRGGGHRVVRNGNHPWSPF